MKLRITAEQYEALSDEFKAEYTQSGDDYVLKLDREVFTPEQVDDKIAGLESKKNELLGEVKNLKGKLEESGKKGNKEDNESARLLQEAMDKIKDLEGELDKGRTQGELSRIQNELKDELAKHSSGKALTQLFRLLKGQVGVHDGRGTVLNDDGKPTISSVKDLVRKAKDSGDYDNLFTGTKAKGGGEGSSTSGSATSKKWADYTSAELKSLRETDQDAYDKLKQTKGK